MAKKQYKNDIFEVLGALDRRNRKYYLDLDEDQQKEIGYVHLRWMSAVQDNVDGGEWYTLASNELVNIGFHDLYKHPYLQWLLMTCIGLGRPVKHAWIKPPSSANKKSPKVGDLLKRHYPLASYKEIDLLLDISSVDDIRDLAIMYGYQDSEVEVFVKEFKAFKK